MARLKRGRNRVVDLTPRMQRWERENAQGLAVKHYDHMTSAMERVAIGRYAREKGGVIVEIGRHKGTTTLVIATHCARNHINYHIHSIDPTLRNLVYKESAINVTNYVATSQEVGLTWKEPIDFLLIDGDHSEEVCRADFMLFSPHVVPGGYVAFHDTHVHQVDNVLKEIPSEEWRLLNHINILKVYEKLSRD